MPIFGGELSSNVFHLPIWQGLCSR
jgi:hypothetical protein